MFTRTKALPGDVARDLTKRLAVDSTLAAGRLEVEATSRCQWNCSELVNRLLPRADQRTGNLVASGRVSLSGLRLILDVLGCDLHSSDE